MVGQVPILLPLEMPPVSPQDLIVIGWFLFFSSFFYFFLNVFSSNSKHS